MSDSSPRCPASLADELGAVRDRIKSLKAREGALRRLLSDARANAPVEGTRYFVTVRHGTARRFDRAALPDAILQDPRYWKQVSTKTVTSTLRVDDAGLAQKKERRFSDGINFFFPALDAPQDSFEVVEPF